MRLLTLPPSCKGSCTSASNPFVGTPIGQAWILVVIFWHFMLNLRSTPLSALDVKSGEKLKLKPKPPLAHALFLVMQFWLT